MILNLINSVLHTPTDRVDQNSATGAIQKCCNCCTECIDGFLNFINKECFAQVYLKGQDYCDSTWDSMKTITQGLGTFYLVHGAVDGITFFGIVGISSICSLVCYLFVTQVSI